MKTKLLTLLVISFFHKNVSAQIYTYAFNNNKTPYYYTLQQDSTKKLWQIGEPTKPQFNTGDNQGFVFCTDLNNPLQPNDTFSFTINFRKLIRTFFGISLVYKKYGGIDDKAIFELSVDSGKSWVNLMDEDTLFDIQWFSDKPNFTQNDSAEWKNVDLDLTAWAMNKYNKYNKNFWASNLIQLKITYVCDSSKYADRAGMVIDNLLIYSFHEGVNSKTLIRNQLAYPNPASKSINIKSAQPIKNISIYNHLGQLVLKRPFEDSSSNELNIQHLNSGVYMLKIEDVNGGAVWEKLIKE